MNIIKDKYKIVSTLVEMKNRLTPFYYSYVGDFRRDPYTTLYKESYARKIDKRKIKEHEKMVSSENSWAFEATPVEFGFSSLKALFHMTLYSKTRIIWAHNNPMTYICSREIVGGRQSLLVQKPNVFSIESGGSGWSISFAEST